MSELTVTAKFTFDKENLETVKTELLKLIEPTRKEEGCLCYDLHQDTENECILFFYETWATRELWDAHMESAHVKTCLKELDGKCTSVELGTLTKIS